MTNFETDVTVSVFVDTDYHYEVSAGDMLHITYVEHVDTANSDKERRTDLSFGSLEEMEAVANAMLKVVKFRKGI